MRHKVQQTEATTREQRAREPCRTTEAVEHSAATWCAQLLASCQAALPIALHCPTAPADQGQAQAMPPARPIAPVARLLPCVMLPAALWQYLHPCDHNSALKAILAAAAAAAAAAALFSCLRSRPHAMCKAECNVHGDMQYARQNATCVATCKHVQGR